LLVAQSSADCITNISGFDLRQAQGCDDVVPDQHLVEEIEHVILEEPKGQFIELTFVDHAESWPYVVMSQCKIMCNPAASKSFLASIANGKRELYIRDALMLVLKKLKKREMTMLIDSSLPQRILEKVQVNKEKDFLVEFSCRRMGSDNGMDTLYHMDENLRRALEHMNETLYQPQQT
jgi:hypothetical protein